MSTDLRPSQRYVDPVPLLDAVATVFEQLGMLAQHARWAGEAIIDADRSGAGSHGLIRLRHYVDLLERGLVTPRAALRIESSDGAVLRLDAGNALGQVAGTWLIDRSLEVVRELGAAVVTMRRGNHLGALGTYVRRAALAGAGAVLTQATSPNMTAYGGVDARLGNNPFAVGLPTGLDYPLVLDVSCSAAARGKMLIAQQTGQRLPEGWAVRADGSPARTADEGIAGTLLPFAGHKGAALATVLGALSGVLAGSAFGQHIAPPRQPRGPRDIGCFAVIFDISRFGPVGGYEERMADYLGFVLDGRSTGEPITVPGKDAELRRVESAGGVQLPVGVWNDLQDLFASRGIAIPESADRTPDREDVTTTP